VYVIYNRSKHEICNKVEYVASPLPPIEGIQDDADITIYLHPLGGRGIVNLGLDGFVQSSLEVC